MCLYYDWPQLLFIVRWQQWNCATEEGGDESVSKWTPPNTRACFYEWNGYSSNPPILIFLPSSKNRRARFVFPILLWPLERSLGKSCKASWKVWNESLSLPSNFLVQTKTLFSPRSTLPFDSKAAISQCSFLWQQCCQLVLQQGYKALYLSIYVMLLIAWQ